MHDIYALKEMLCDELEEYGRKGEMSAGTLEIVDKLAHAIKNLDKIIEKYEDEEYSSMGGGSYAGRGGMNRGGRSSRGGRSYDGGYNMGGMSNAGRRNARRDSRGRYSGDAEEIISQLEDMMDTAPDEETRMELQRLVKKMKNA